MAADRDRGDHSLRTAFLDFPQFAIEVSARLESEVAERYGLADAG